jgi:hypothetical protein
MGTMVSVQADTRAETEAMLAELCEKVGLRPLGAGRAFEVPGRGGRWMARAEPQREQQVD